MMFLILPETQWLMDGSNKSIDHPGNGSNLNICTVRMDLIGQTQSDAEEWIKVDGMQLRLRTSGDPQNASGGWSRASQDLFHDLGGLVDWWTHCCWWKHPQIVLTPDGMDHFKGWWWHIEKVPIPEPVICLCHVPNAKFMDLIRVIHL
jgi:hypothetical protein